MRYRTRAACLIDEPDANASGSLQIVACWAVGWFRFWFAAILVLVLGREDFARAFGAISPFVVCVCVVFRGGIAYDWACSCACVFAIKVWSCSHPLLSLVCGGVSVR